MVTASLHVPSSLCDTGLAQSVVILYVVMINYGLHSPCPAAQFDTSCPLYKHSACLLVSSRIPIESWAIVAYSYFHNELAGWLYIKTSSGTTDIHNVYEPSSEPGRTIPTVRSCRDPSGCSREALVCERNDELADLLARDR